MKKIRRKNKIKAIFVFILYILLISLQLECLTPYIETKTYISEQNVPHTVTIGKGYSYYGCTWTTTDELGNITSTMLDRQALMLQFAITTLIAFLFYRFIRTKEDTNLQDLEPPIPKISEVEPEEMQPKPRKRKHIIKRIIYIFIVACLCLSNYITYDFYLDAKDDKESLMDDLSKEREKNAQKANNQKSGFNIKSQSQTSQSQPQQQVVVIREEEDNICEYPGCNFTKSLSGDYCLIHTCNEPLCYERVVSGSSYCSEHKCLAPDCNSSRQRGSYFCFTHSR